MKHNGVIIVRGDSLGTIESKNERGQTIGYSVQVMKHGAKGYDLLKIRLPEGAKPENFKEGMPVELAVDLSNYEGQMYYRATHDLRDEKPEVRNGIKPSAAA